MKISIDHIEPDPNQPRKIFDAAELETLANSIQQNGLMQPIEVRAGERRNRYFIVAGERRYRAHKLLLQRGVKRFGMIEVMVKEPRDTITLRVRQIVENIARDNLKPLEEAQSYADLLKLGLTPEKAAQRLGVPLTRFTSRVALLNLEPTIAKLLGAGQIETPQALEIARLPRQADQMKILQMINRGELGKWKSLKAAIDAMLEGVTQADMFGSVAKATEEEVKTLNVMERKIETVAGLLSAGWSKGACIIANKVSPNRAALIADKLAAIRLCVRQMEQELRNVNAQVRVALENQETAA